MITPKYYPRSAESAGTVGTCTVGEAVFTHPRVGQASRPAIRRPQFRAEARTHFAIRSRRAEKETGRCPVIDSATYRVLRCCNKEELFFSVMESPNDSSSVCPCGPLCRANGGRVASVHTPPDEFGPAWTLVEGAAATSPDSLFEGFVERRNAGSLGLHFQVDLSKIVPQ